MRDRTTGFTLLEVSIVLILVSLLTTTVVVSVAGRHRRMGMDTWVTQFKHWESQGREQARRSRTPYQLIVQTDTGVCQFVQEQSQEPVGLGLTLPRTLTLPAVRLQEQDGQKGQIAIPYSAQGHSPTYALRIIHEKTNHWLVVAGMTGQVIETPSESTVDAIMASLQ